jgi:hypothetical protein
MRHLENEELVGLVFDKLAGQELDAYREHLRACPRCSAAFEGLARAVVLLEKEPTEAPPPFAWSRLKARMEGSGASRDWAEPAWTPLILGNVAGIILVLLFIFLAGGWLEKGPIWPAIRTWSVAARIGPRGLAALIFFGAGALVTLALTPIFWWEQWRARKGIVK